MADKRAEEAHRLAESRPVVAASTAVVGVTAIVAAKVAEDTVEATADIAKDTVKAGADVAEDTVKAGIDVA